jgi:O-antigen ligase
MALTGPNHSAIPEKQDGFSAAPPRRFVMGKESARALRRKRSSELWLMLFLLALSGNPVFTTPEVNRVLIPIVAVVFGALILGRRRKTRRYRLLPVVVIFGIIVGIQAVHFMFLPAFTLLGLFCRFTVAFEFVALIPDFAGTYIRAVTVLAVMAMIFFFTNLAGSAVGIDIAGATRHFALPVQFNSGSWTFLLHTYSINPTDATRNAGMFWEPGAFAGYLNLALLFLCIIRSRFTKKSFYLQFAVLSVCLLTTQSTLGYVAFAVVILLALFSGTTIRIRSKARTIIAAACILVAFATVAVNLRFMIPKIEHSIILTTAKSGSWQADRLGNLIFDFKYIVSRPLTGWGVSDQTRLMLDPELKGNALVGRGNGMSSFAAEFGIPALLLWLYCFYRILLSLSSGRKMVAVAGLIVILITLNDEAFFSYPLFLSFFFLANLFSSRVVQVRAIPRGLQACPE